MVQTLNVSGLIQSVDLELSQRNHNEQTEPKTTPNGPKCWQRLVGNWPEISQPIGLLAIGIILWVLGRILAPDYVSIASVLTRMFCLFVGAQICGIILRIVQWPEMLGMLGFGVLYANIGLANFDGFNEFEVFFRDLALVNIMLLAGMGIDLKAFVQKICPVLRLSVLPTVGEVLIIAVFGRYVLLMPFIWSILLGLVMTAVSPNVVIDIVLWLRVQELGLYKGIHTIIIAMTSINDVLSIFVFNVVLGMIFSTDSLSVRLLQGPIGMAIGFVYGFVYGLGISKVIPSEASTYANGIRFSLMVLGGLLSVLGSRAIGFPSAGALGCVVLACTCGRSWQKPKHQKHVNPCVQCTKNYIDCNPLVVIYIRFMCCIVAGYLFMHHHEPKNNHVHEQLNLLWRFVKPISFALIGKEVIFARLDAALVGYGVVIVIVGCCIRMLLSYALLYGADMHWKERLYITMCSLPKATVQAALAPVALDLVRKNNLNEYHHLANIILIVAVLAIVITAPLGAILMVKFAPKFLQKSQATPSI